MFRDRATEQPRHPWPETAAATSPAAVERHAIARFLTDVTAIYDRADVERVTPDARRC